MPRKHFRQDMSRAATPGLFPHLSDIKEGDNDDSIAFTFTSPTVSIDLQAIVSGKCTRPRSVQHGLSLLRFKRLPKESRLLRIYYLR